MADFPSRLDLFALGRAYTLQRATKIDPGQIDVIGSDVNIYVGSTSHVAYALVLQLAYAVNRLLLDGAVGEDLDRYAWDRYQLTRFGATAAVGPARIFRATAAALGGTIPLGTKVKTLVGTEYITTSVCTFAPADLSKSVSVRCTQAGKSAQVGKNQIRRFSNLAVLWDQSLQIINDAGPTAGGEDVEDDDTFKERIRDFWNTARRGTLGAIEYGARQTPGVVSAQAQEALTTDGNPARVVFLYIADSSGVASDELAQAVRANLFDFRAGGIAVIVSNSLPQIAQITLLLTFQAGVDTNTLTTNIRAAIVEYVNSLPVNGTLHKGAISSVLERFTNDGLIPNDATIVTPVGDLVPAIGSTLRTTLTNVTTL
jgi:uncharacterized phage protein gp47/JayE